MKTASPEARAHSLLTGLVLIWAVSWPVTKVGVSAMPPLWFACLRYVVATACCFGVVALRGELRRPARGDWPLVAVSGVLQMGAYSALTATALTQLAPGRASVLAFSTPLWVVPLSAWWLKERLTRRKVAGVGAGLVGVLVIASPGLAHASRDQLLPYALLLCAAAAWAISIVYVRVHRFQTPTLALAPWQMLVALLLLFPLAILLERRWPILTPRAVAALTFVGPIATAFAYWAAIEVGRSVRATTMSMVLLAVPSLGLLLLAVTLHESMSLSVTLGLVLVAAGIVATRATVEPPQLPVHTLVHAK